MEVIQKTKNYGNDVNFPSDWETMSIKDLFIFFSTATYSRTDLNDIDRTLYVHYGDIHTKFNYHLDLNKVDLPRIADEKVKKYELLIEGDLIIADASEDFEGVGKAIEIINVKSKQVISGLHTFLLRDKNGYFSPKYKGYSLLSCFTREQFYRFATGTKVYSISKDVLGNIKIPLPALSEQKAIADCLSIWDNAIDLQIQLINAKENRKKVLMQQLLTGKKRLPGFSEEWKEFKLKDFIDEYINKSNETSDLPVFTSSKNGLMMQLDYYSGGRMTSRDNVNYNILPNNHITYRSRSDDGLFTFNINDKGFDGLISGYYPVFKIINGNILFFLYFLNFFKSKLTKYSSGTSQLVLSVSSLKRAKFNLPTFDEQNVIAKFLETSDKEFQLEKQKLANLKLQKNGLMQQLLTGKVRLV